MLEVGLRFNLSEDRIENLPGPGVLIGVESSAAVRCEMEPRGRTV